MNLPIPRDLLNLANFIFPLRLISSVNWGLNSPRGSLDKAARWITASIPFKSSSWISLISLFINLLFSSTLTSAQSKKYPVSNQLRYNSFFNSSVSTLPIYPFEPVTRTFIWFFSKKLSFTHNLWKSNRFLSLYRYQKYLLKINFNFLIIFVIAILELIFKNIKRHHFLESNIFTKFFKINPKLSVSRKFLYLYISMDVMSIRSPIY